MKSNAQHLKETINTAQATRHAGDRETEREKQKLNKKDADPRQQALQKHPKDSEQK